MLQPLSDPSLAAGADTDGVGSYWVGGASGAAVAGGRTSGADPDEAWVEVVDEVGASAFGSGTLTVLAGRLGEDEVCAEGTDWRGAVAVGAGAGARLAGGSVVVVTGAGRLGVVAAGASC